MDSLFTLLEALVFVVAVCGGPLDNFRLGCALGFSIWEGSSGRGNLVRFAFDVSCGCVRLGLFFGMYTQYDLSRALPRVLATIECIPKTRGYIQSNTLGWNHRSHSYVHTMDFCRFPQAITSALCVKAIFHCQCKGIYDCSSSV